jgi:hypothetical protein
MEGDRYDPARFKEFYVGLTPERTALIHALLDAFRQPIAGEACDERRAVI